MQNLFIVISLLHCYLYYAKIVWHRDIYVIRGSESQKNKVVGLILCASQVAKWQNAEIGNLRIKNIQIIKYALFFPQELWRNSSLLQVG